MKSRVGLDLHGVVDDNPYYWRGWAAAHIWAGIKIYIISGPSKEEIAADLDKAGFAKGIHYNEILSVVDYLKEKKVNMWLDYKNTWWAGDEDWWTAKGELCEKHEIDEMWDDQARYKEGFPEGHRTKLFIYTKGYISEGKWIDVHEGKRVREFLEACDKCAKSV